MNFEGQTAAATAKVLLVEDQDDLRENLAEYLRLEGYDVVTAANGRLAFDHAIAFLPEVIVSDLAMPEMDGRQLFRALREHVSTADIPVIFLSAWADRQNVRDGMQLGASDYITKPFRVEEVTAAIETQVKAARRRREALEANRDDVGLRLVRRLPHELLTHLNGILQSSQKLATIDSGLRQEDAAELGRSIYVNARRLQRAMENLLMHISFLSRNGSSCTPVSLCGASQLLLAVTSGVLEICSMLDMPAERVRISGEAKDAPIRPEDLQKLVMELVENALRFSPRESIVDVQLGGAEEGFVLCVTDQGCGIPASEIAALSSLRRFEPERTDQHGLGLGLTICHSIMESCGGSLLIESREGGPTSVTCRFPRAE